ncbi:hypothetical protein Bca4012_061264 [Brassica carinata]
MAARSPDGPRFRRQSKPSTALLAARTPEFRRISSLTQDFRICLPFLNPVSNLFAVLILTIIAAMVLSLVERATQSERETHQAVKRQREKTLKDPVKAHKPELPMSGLGHGGRVGTTGSSLLTQYLLKTQPETIFATSDDDEDEGGVKK